MSQERIAFVNASEELLLKARAVARRVTTRARHVTGRPKVVLVVENDRATRQVLATLLRQEGHTVEEARDGREALERLRAGPRPDGIILDLLLPDVGGRRFRAEQLRDRDLRAIPVIVLSGEPGAPREAAEMGAVACLGKPIDFDALLGALWRRC
ncbi:MAG TPA: response regulator [Gemmataceae bacterium]|jgi:CheY-like chemotaxis protein|nr:response regulator [Gemmataceae bacterium]